MAVEIVGFPIKNGGSFHSYVNVYQRVPPNDGLLQYIWNLDWVHHSYSVIPTYSNVQHDRKQITATDCNWLPVPVGTGRENTHQIASDV